LNVIAKDIGSHIADLDYLSWLAQSNDIVFVKIYRKSEALRFQKQNQNNQFRSFNSLFLFKG
jgi:hypothetical protein